MYKVLCKNADCAQPIPLPYSNLLERLPFHEVINPNAGSENIACPECGHVFYYTPEDRYPVYFSPGQPQEKYVKLYVATIEFDCAEEKCETPVRIRLPISVSENPNQALVLDKSDTWLIREAYCWDGKQNGHRALLLPPRNTRTVQFSRGTDDL